MIESTVFDTFMRATGTNMNHVSAFMAYTRWCTLTGFAPFPFVESVLYRYVCELRTTGAPATKAKSFVTTMAVMHDLLELPGLPASLRSARVDNCAKDCYRKKRKTKRAPALRREQVVGIEQVTMQDDDPWLAYMAAYLLFILYGRLRALDTARIDNEPVLDRHTGTKGCVTATYGPHKNQGAPRNASEDKPIFAPNFGLTCRWGKRFIDLRQRFDFDADAAGVFMTGVDVTREPIDGTLFDAATVTLWLREVLIQAGFSVSDVANFTSHSLNATLLRRGVP